MKVFGPRFVEMILLDDEEFKDFDILLTSRSLSFDKVFLNSFLGIKDLGEFSFAVLIGNGLTIWLT